MGCLLKGKRFTNSWYISFEAAKNKKLLILQHIFLGMNAHINLDLGISAASIMPNRKIAPLKKDFENINNVIASINQKVQDFLNQICYPVELICCRESRFTDFKSQNPYSRIAKRIEEMREQ